ncbi:hypothetical protein XBO1_850023 [Xenorhabdus bovienii str. oregonense]|uniref:Uncharacterized protein n=1 Tax=Xenorhabdus bovienii str. oregonense TaxID=1398202 RepID=A0A077P0Q6_XENBV|nr:hypothetical protein XBO1_850023 [Xenorhabdus bovienii str. oregonense]
MIDWAEICLDGSNIRASKDAAGAKKNIPISLTIMRWVANAVVSGRDKRRLPRNAHPVVYCPHGT